MLNKIKVDFYNDDEFDVSSSMRAYMKRALMEAVKLFGLNNKMQVSVSFVGEEKIKEYNSINRGIDKVTDVLSFPLQNFSEGNIDNDDISDGEYDENGNLMLGDVVICTKVAQRQAEEYCHSVERETVYLFVHSILHLMGFDHEKDDEKKRMREAEEKIMNKIGLSRDE